MNALSFNARRTMCRVARSFFALFLTFAMPLATAAPGAHGPDGEHLDAPGAKSGSSRAPRLETQSDSFELVAVMGGGELSILIDRYATNEPVLGASLEVEFGTLKAKAKFHADHGDYAIDDAAFLKAISAPGAHPLVFTLTAGNDSDLLTGTLHVATPADAHDHTFLGIAERTWLIGTALLVVVIAIFIVVRWRRSRRGHVAWRAHA